MILQLLPDQLVDVWPGIQAGVEEVGRIVSGNSKFMPNVLANLLAGKFQLWVALNEARETYGFAITCIGKDPLTEETYLNIEVVYGFRKVTDEIVYEYWDKLKEYALAYGCDYIRATTSVARAAELLKQVGAEERSRNYVARIS